jgi:hypothetical protein
MISVEVICVLPQQVWRHTVQVPAGTTAQQLLEQAELAAWLVVQQVDAVAFGVYGQKISPDTYVLVDGDRLEIYRGLTRDPKDVRRVRANRHPVGRRWRQK